MKPIIHSEKHYIQNTLSTVVAGAVETHVIAEAVDTVGSVNKDVAVGAIIKAIYVEDWVRANDAVAGSFVFVIVKLPNGAGTPTAGDMANLNDYKNKNNIIFTAQGLTNDKLSDAVNITRNWFKIPKGKQRMSLGDEWMTVLFAQALDQNHCGVFTYKEYL